MMNAKITMIGMSNLFLDVVGFSTGTAEVDIFGIIIIFIADDETL